MVSALAGSDMVLDSVLRYGSMLPR
jgi:hypothetical protein